MHWFTYENKILLVFFHCLCICSFCFNQTYTIGRKFHSPQMCLGDGNKDCSFQFPASHKTSCFIYGTNVCSNYDFSTWNLKPLSKPVSESDSGFAVSVLPYAVYIDEMHEEYPVSAINISLTSVNTDIKAFSIVMTDDVEGRNICRIVDFRNSAVTFNIPFTLFYDCFRYLVEDHLENVALTFRAYPLNTELSYSVHIPPVPAEKFTSPCDWIPLVMIFRGSLQKHHIQIKISNVPKELNLTFVVLTLWTSSDVEVETLEVPSTSIENMISKDFFSVEGGFYSISVSISSAQESCTVFKSDEFLVGIKPKDYSFITFIILLIIMTFFGCGLFYFSCRWYLKLVATSKPTLLLVYHYKQLQQEILSLYCTYLEIHYGVKVNTIYGRSGNPREWLVEKFLESNIIVFVISEGLFQIFNKNTSDEGEHHWDSQLPEAIDLIFNSSYGTKKFCKISFPYSGRHHIPKSLEHRGPFFMLPNELNKFLCFIHSCPWKLYFLNKLFCANHHIATNSNLKHEDEEKIKIKLMSLMKGNFEDFPLIGSNKKDLHHECKNHAKTLNENYNTITPSDFFNRCKAENRFSLYESDSKNIENDDFILYCIGKMLKKGNKNV